MITKEWIDEYDSIVQQKLQPLSDVKIVRILNSVPQDWESLLTYTIGTEVHNFKPGDEVRISKEDSYEYYKLYSVENNIATWKVLNEKVSSAIVVNLQTIVNGNLVSNSDLNNAIVTVQSDTTINKFWNGNQLIFDNLSPVKQYTVSVSNVDGYNTPLSYTISNIGIGQTVSHNFQYTADEYTFDIQSNQTDDETITTVVGTISYTGGSKTSHTSIKVPTGTEVNISFPDVTGYKKTVSNQGKIYTALYQTEIVTVILESEEDISNASFTITDDNSNVIGSGISGDSVKVPYNITYTVTAAVLGSLKANSVTNTAGQLNRSITLEYIKGVENGVYAYYSDGSLKGLSEADSNAIGVAVVDDACSFVIGKEDGGTKKFGGYNTDLSAIGIMVSDSYLTSETDFAGYTNTSKLIGRLGTDAAAATWCRTQFSGKGYLPALGEWNLASSLKSDIETMMTAIGGTAIMGAGYWASTLGNSSSKSWESAWGGFLVTEYRSNPQYVRAFSPLYMPVTLTLSSTDGTSIANRNIFIFDKTGESQTVTTDSTGKATANIAVGDVEIRVEGCRTLTKSITLTAAMNSITVEICTPDPGIYAYYEDGTMKSYDDADSTAIGVAVVTSNCSFVIDKNATNNNNTFKFGGYNKDLSSTAVTTDNKTTAQVDFRGEQNTVNIISACAGYDYNVIGAPAAEACRTAFGGKGYMGSLGEWYTAYQNKSNIDSMLTKVGGTALATNSPHWSSTHGNALTNSWILAWDTGYTGSYLRNNSNSYFVRAFCAL